MSLEVSLPRPAEPARFVTGLDAAPTLTLRARQRAGALAAVEAARLADAAPGQGPRAVTVAGAGFTMTLTL